jgi:hypothetical protein
MGMKNISYSLTPSIQTNVQTVELIKRDILCTSLSPKTERRARFDALVARIHAIVMLGGMEQTKKDVLTLLTASPAKQPEHSPILALKKTLSYIWEEWTMNPRSVSYGTVERLALELGETPRIGTILASELSHHKESIQQLLTFLDTTKDHPVITAFVAFLELVNIGPLGTKTTQLALCVMFMYLHKYGYDLRGMVSLIPSWTSDMRTFGDTMRVSHSSGNFSTFIDFALQRYVSELEAIKTHLTSDQLRFSVPATLISLSDRQKEILSLLDDPTSAITNRVVQKRFNISQITASRELAKLTNLGLLYPHGKGRSVSYTKV